MWRIVKGSTFIWHFTRTLPLTYNQKMLWSSRQIDCLVFGNVKREATSLRFNKSEFIFMGKLASQTFPIRYWKALRTTIKLLFTKTKQKKRVPKHQCIDKECAAIKLWINVFFLLFKNTVGKKCYEIERETKVISTNYKMIYKNIYGTSFLFLAWQNVCAIEVSVVLFFRLQHKIQQKLLPTLINCMFSPRYYFNRISYNQRCVFHGNVIVFCQFKRAVELHEAQRKINVKWKR